MGNKFYLPLTNYHEYIDKSGFVGALLTFTKSCFKPAKFVGTKTPENLNKNDRIKSSYAFLVREK